MILMFCELEPCDMFWYYFPLNIDIDRKAVDKFAYYSMLDVTDANILCISCELTRSEVQSHRIKIWRTPDGCLTMSLN